MTTVTGYAVQSFGRINVATVSPTARGAMVNWLVVNPRIMIFSSDTDETISMAFEDLKGRDHKLIEVSIQPAAARARVDSPPVPES